MKLWKNGNLEKRKFGKMEIKKKWKLVIRKNGILGKLMLGKMEI